jgi:anaerobic ribonucleoside-triphosphate reductase
MRSKEVVSIMCYLDYINCCNSCGYNISEVTTKTRTCLKCGAIEPVYKKRRSFIKESQ